MQDTDILNYISDCLDTQLGDWWMGGWGSEKSKKPRMLARELNGFGEYYLYESSVLPGVKIHQTEINIIKNCPEAFFVLVDRFKVWIKQHENASPIMFSACLEQKMVRKAD